MFDSQQLSNLDGVYFNIILADDRDVTIQSRNTGHYWYLHNTGYPTDESCIIFHKKQLVMILERYKDSSETDLHKLIRKKSIKEV